MEYSVRSGEIAEDIPLGPVLELSPEALEFTTPCEMERLTLRNAGDDTVNVTGLRFDVSASSVSMTHSLRLPLVEVLEPGDFREVLFFQNFDGTYEGSGVVKVNSNDPFGIRQVPVTLSIPDEPLREQFVVDGQRLDILIALDRSCSMKDSVPVLPDGLERLIVDMESGVNWQIGAVSKSDGCVNDVVHFLDGNVVNAVIDAVGGAGLIVKPVPPLAHELYRLVDNALRETDERECNEGFLRNDTLLHVVMITDPENNDWAPSWRDWWATWEDLYDRTVVLSTATDCSVDTPPLASTVETGGEMVRLCDAKWGAELADLMSDSLVAARTFRLQVIPEIKTIEVLVDGEPATDWIYLTETNEIRLTSRLSKGTEVTVLYRPAGCVPPPLKKR